MGDSQSLAALKKAYAEIILNTAREAAARVRDADRRASRFHHELCFARDEAVRMLLKLQRMLHAKTVEAETTMAKKQEQIMELEAQLEEAESKILDLRLELESVRDELEVEKAKNNMQSLTEDKSAIDDQNIKERLITGVETVQASCDGIDPLTQFADPGLEGAVGRKTDLATMIIGRKEPELYRNGCTQRVRAYEGHPLQGTLGCELNCGAHDKGGVEVRSYSQSQDSKMAKVIPLKNLERPAIMRRRQRKIIWRKKWIPAYANQWRRQHLVSSLLRKMSRIHDFNTSQDKTVKDKGRRKARRNSLIGEFQFPNQSNITESSCLRLDKATSIERRTKSKEFDYVGTINEKKSEESSGTGVVAEEVGKVKDYSVSAKREDDNATDNVLVPYEESDPGSNSLNSDIDVGSNVQEVGSCLRCDDNRLVKYTFQRKRKRAFSSSDGENKAPQENTVKKHAGIVIKSQLESEGCKATNEPSRDSRRLAQVARQLIALSGKRR